MIPQDFSKMYEEFKPIYYERYKLDATPREVFRNALLDGKITYGQFVAAGEYFGDKWEENIL